MAEENQVEPQQITKEPQQTTKEPQGEAVQPPSRAQPVQSQALHGLAPKCELINVHELIKTSTNNYVTLLPLKTGINLNTKG